MPELPEVETVVRDLRPVLTDRVVLGIRAQDVKAGSQNSANEVLVHGMVEVIERIGPVRVAHVHTPAGVVKCMQGVDATHVGEALTVSLPESSCLAFDAASGNRLNFMGH
jgi:multiple sugar transport system ATP-binding protein